MALVHKREPDDCRGLAVMVQLYVDEELAAEERGDVESHLATCAACTASRDELLTLKQRLREPHAPPPPDALTERVRADFQKARTQGARRRGALMVLGVTALALLVAVGSTLLYARGANDAETRRDTLTASVAALHQLRVPVDVATPDVRTAARFLRPRLSGPIVVPALDDLGFVLGGARVVDVQARRGALLVYTGRLGERLSITALPGARDVATRALLIGPPQVQRVAHTAQSVVFATHKDALYAATGELSKPETDALRARLAALP